MKREFVCINCPMGCLLTVTGELGSLRIEGYTCPRGLSYAESEVTDPRRTVTALVQVEGRRQPLSVKTLTPVPKAMVAQCAAALKRVTVRAPIAIGDIVVADLCGTGCAVAATEEIA